MTFEVDIRCDVNRGFRGGLTMTVQPRGRTCNGAGPAEFLSGGIRAEATGDDCGVAAGGNAGEARNPASEPLKRRARRHVIRTPRRHEPLPWNVPLTSFVRRSEAIFAKVSSTSTPRSRRGRFRGSAPRSERTQEPHIVPLSPQAVACLRRLEVRAGGVDLPDTRPGRLPVGPRRPRATDYCPIPSLFLDLGRRADRLPL